MFHPPTSMEVDKCGQFPVLVEEDGLSSGRAINFRSIFVSASVYIYIYILAPVCIYILYKIVFHYVIVFLIMVSLQNELGQSKGPHRTWASHDRICLDWMVGALLGGMAQQPVCAWLRGPAETPVEGQESQFSLFEDTYSTFNHVALQH